MKETMLREQVRTWLSRGTLPHEPVTSVVAGYGTDSHGCAVCERTIRTHEVEYRSYFEPAACVLHMHGFCFLIWERERRSCDPPASARSTGAWVQSDPAGAPLE